MISIIHPQALGLTRSLVAVHRLRLSSVAHAGSSWNPTLMVKATLTSYSTTDDVRLESENKVEDRGWMKQKLRKKVCIAPEDREAV